MYFIYTLLAILHILSRLLYYFFLYCSHARYITRARVRCKKKFLNLAIFHATRATFRYNSLSTIHLHALQLVQFSCNFPDFVQLVQLNCISMQ